MYFGSYTGSTPSIKNNPTESSRTWASTAHWIAIIGYDVVNEKEKMYIADSGHSLSGWYPITEFDTIKDKISHVYIVQEK